jgi:predicted metal-dependent hydrolase
MLKSLRNLVAPPAVEQRATRLAGKRISYTLKRSRRRRSIGLRVDDRGLTVSMPLRASERWLNSVLQAQANWVVKKLDGWQQRKSEEISWVDGGMIPFVGEQLMLRVQPSLVATAAQREDEVLSLFVANNDAAQIEQAVLQWYRQRAENLFAERVAYYAPLLNVAPTAIKLSRAKTLWGSCTTRGVVRLNERLIRLPLHLIDYVVVHELAHLREMNHSEQFWTIVQSACPDYRMLRKELSGISGLR